VDSANITKVGAAYDGLKSALNVMVNITDGLPWPLKAAPQTLLYILQLFEVRIVWDTQRIGFVLTTSGAELPRCPSEADLPAVLCSKNVEGLGENRKGGQDGGR